MEHQKPVIVKAKNKFLNLIPKATQAVTVSFQHMNPPYSPAKEKRSDQYLNNKPSKTHIGKGFSGTLVPVEARRKPKNSSFTTHEPTSPKVSCLGTIKCKHAQNKKMVPVPSKEDKRRLALTEDKRRLAALSTVTPVPASPAVKRKKLSVIKSIFNGRKSDVSHDRVCKTPTLAPGIGEMKRFASGRETFANFDWTNPTAQVEPEYFSDEEVGNYHSDGDVDKEVVIISFSAPILTNGVAKVSKNKFRGMDLEPRKEINLWKRRTMAQPKPLVI